MKIATAFSTAGSAKDALQAASADVARQLGAEPQLVILSYSEQHDAQALAQAADELPAGVRVHGASSCLGAMSEQGYRIEGGPQLFLFALADRDGAYGVGSAELATEPRSAGAQATRRAIDSAERPGETIPRHEIVQGESALGDRTADVQINRLRRKIEVDPANPLHLVTVRGQGYRLKTDQVGG